MAIPKDLPSTLESQIMRDLMDRVHLLPNPQLFRDPLTGRIESVSGGFNGSWSPPQAPHSDPAAGAGAGSGTQGGAAAGTGSASAGTGAGAGLTAVQVGDVLRATQIATQQADLTTESLVRLLEEIQRMKEQQAAAAMLGPGQLVRTTTHLAGIYIDPRVLRRQICGAFFAGSDPIPAPPPIETCAPEVGEIIAWRIWRYVAEVPEAAGVPVYCKGVLVGRLMVRFPDTQQHLILGRADVPAGNWFSDAAPLTYTNITCGLTRDRQRNVIAVEAPSRDALYGVSGFTRSPENAGLLRSLSTDHVWQPGSVMEGELDATPSWKGTRTGIHALRTLQAAIEHAVELRYHKPEPMVIGSISLWGGVVEHERGFRAENGRIRSLDEVVMPGAPREVYLSRHAPPEARVAPDLLPNLRKRYGL